jgi:putative endonuclease
LTTEVGQVATHAQRKAVGGYGERLASRHLERRGMVVLDRNWRCAEGEIDIVARDGTTLVVCEVKCRTSTRYGTPFEAITPAKAQRLFRLGVRWARAHGLGFVDLRVDVVTVLIGRGCTVEHLVGVA